MTFRTRLLAASLIAASIPLALFAYGVRREMTQRLTAQYELRVSTLVEAIEADLAEESRAIGRKLELIKSSILDDTRFRLAAVAGLPDERPYLLDYAQRAMRLSGLDMLQVQDDEGRIVSSGHFRNEYDFEEPEVPTLLARGGAGVALVRARTPEGPFVALARVDSFQLGARRFTLTGGTAIDDAFLSRLARDERLRVTLTLPSEGVTEGSDAPVRMDEGAGAEGAAAGRVVAELVVPYIGPGGLARGEADSARISVIHDVAALAELRQSVDRWFIIAISATALAAIVLSVWLSARVGRPLADLARKTSRIDLDRLDMRFEGHRRDEIGTLSRVLGAMTGRLRASAARLREAERRATIGELARQVNHDIKNGLTPIRNVFRHLMQVSESDPAQLPRVLEERRATIDSGITYLERLASSYARLYPRVEHRPTDVNAVVRQLLAHAGEPERVEIRAELDGAAPAVLADPVVLRRVLENLIDNAVDALEGRSGTVTVRTEGSGQGPEARVRVVVRDTGKGMTAEEKAHAFDDFYTTKSEGTGLGLSIVRRLVMDLSGTLRVESRPGAGSAFTVELPAVDPERAAAASAEESDA